MAPLKPLPFGDHFVEAEAYVESLLSFVTSSELFGNLCGGVHILDFLTQDHDLYSSLFPSNWRHFFDSRDVSDILHLLMRSPLVFSESSDQDGQFDDGVCPGLHVFSPPRSLLEYIRLVRQHSLDRSLSITQDDTTTTSNRTMARHVSIGMKPKKIHEVSRLARYVDDLSSEISRKYSCHMSHLVDFGSGQNYLGRALASPPYERKVIAIESKPLNIDGARNKDVTAKLAKKQVILRNKKQYRSQKLSSKNRAAAGEANPGDFEPPLSPLPKGHSFIKTGNHTKYPENNILYIESVIQDGNLSPTLARLPPKSLPPQNLMVISLHSCGNLLHHGLRSLTLNPSIRAVALVGCCYNLLTERLPPPSSQPSTLRTPHPRLQQTSSACDPHGFPMSERFATYPHQHGPGIKFNITARMMAVQAPQNWTEMECESFFTRHFYRALLQKIFVDTGVVQGSNQSDDDPQGSKNVILGSLRKQCYTSFTSYVRAAIAKLEKDPAYAEKITTRLQYITDEEIQLYEQKYGHKKKELSIVWSLMAFSAGVMESAIVIDRWQWLREQREVKECWVENIFEYGISPRNLVVVGIKG